VYSEEDLRSIVSAPIVGMIPRSAQLRTRVRSGDPPGAVPPGLAAASAGPTSLIEPHGLIAEAFRALRTNLSFLLPQHHPGVVLLTSPAQGDGKSLIALNLAHVMAQQGRSVVLVDADLRRGGLHELLGIPSAPGLSDWLAGGGASAAPIRLVDSSNCRFAVLTRGSRPPNPSELIGGPSMSRLLAELSGTYDVVLLDSPPLSAVTDPAVLSGHADGVLLVVRAGKTTHQELRYAQKELEMIGAPVLGVLLNDIHDELRNVYVGAYQYE
jgi:capsular exopolysaccharide synthesis family protein